MNYAYGMHADYGPRYGATTLDGDESVAGAPNTGANDDLLDVSALTSSRTVVLTGHGPIDGYRGTEAAIQGTNSGFTNIDAVLGSGDDKLQQDLDLRTHWDLGGDIDGFGPFGSSSQVLPNSLSDAGVLADGVTTVAYSYIGPELTWPIYRDGTIGRAKVDLEEACARIGEKLSATGGRAFVSVNKAVVTQASSAIPVVPLYISILFKVMKEAGTHEDCIEQVYRLFGENLYGGSPNLDESGRILRSFQDPEGTVVDRVTAAEAHGGHLYLTSIAGDWIARCPLAD